jgi:flagellar biosynthetic protein FlhB
VSTKGTEQATPQRKQKAKAKGDTVRSRELLSAMAMLGGVGMLGAIAHSFSASWGRVYVESLRAAGLGDIGEHSWSPAIQRMLVPALMPVGLVMASSFLGALIAGIGQGGGISIHPELLALKLERLNPVTNDGNLFNLR